MTHPPPITRDGAQHAAHRELSKAIYHHERDPLVVRAFRGIGHFIDRLLNHAAARTPGGGLGALALVVLLVVVIVVIVWRVGVPGRTATIGAVLAADRSMTAAGHRALAERATEIGDWHTAVVERMRAVACDLEERGVIEPRAGRTATELSVEAGVALPIAAADLRVAAEVFNAVAYGGGEATRSDTEAVAAADDAVRRAGHRALAAT